MNQVFRDPGVQLEFETNGYVKLPWLEVAEVERLRDLYERLAVGAPGGFFFSQVLPSSELRSAVRQGILEVSGQRLRATFSNPSALQCSFMTKTRGDGKAEYVSPHQDWTFVDETEGDVSINIWCPLEETGDHNGNLYMVPMSHRLRRYPRVAQPSRTPYQDYYDALRQAAVAVPTKLGEAILFDNAVVHFSSRNRTDSVRLVAGTMVIQESAKPVLYYQNPDDPALLDEYHSGIEYFLEKPFGSRPDTFLRSIPKTVLSEAEAVAEIRRLYPHITNGGAPTVDSPAASGPAEAPASRSRRFLRRLFG